MLSKLALGGQASRASGPLYVVRARAPNPGNWMTSTCGLVAVVFLAVGVSCQLGTLAFPLAAPRSSSSSEFHISQSCAAQSLETLEWVLRGDGLGVEAMRLLDCQRASLLDLRNAARSEGLHLIPVEITWGNLVELSAPVIAHFEGENWTHFAVVEVAAGWTRLIARDRIAVALPHKVRPFYTDRALADRKALHQRLPPDLIDIEESVIDFGIAEPGRVLTHVFVLRNATNRAIRIADVDCPQDCTWTLTPSKEVPQNGEARLEVVWRICDAGPGAAEQRHLVLTTDHPGRRRYVCSLLGCMPPAQ